MNEVKIIEDVESKEQYLKEDVLFSWLINSNI